MNARHGLASLIWAAILVIAVQFVASSAWAHAGHSHDHAAATHAVAAHTDQKGKSISKAQTEQPVELSATSSQRSDPAPADTGGCTGGCCGNGIGCCGAAIAAAASSLPEFDVQQSPVPIASLMSAGIDPKALKRPPRTFA